MARKFLGNNWEKIAPEQGVFLPEEGKVIRGKLLIPNNSAWDFLGC